MLDEYTIDDLYIRHAVDMSPELNKYSFHVHDRCEIFYFVSGNAEYLVEGSVYPLRRGSTLIMRAGEAHCIRMLRPERYERYAVNFPLSLFDSLDPERLLTCVYTDRELGSDNMYITDDTEHIIEDMFETGLDRYQRGIRISVGILNILDKLSRINAKHITNDLSFEQQLLSYVNEHLFDDLTADKLAGHFYISRSQLGRVFRKAAGAAPWEYITAKRLVAAKDMIEHGTSAKKAALSCGFGDYSCFYRAYVKRFGKSPKG
ncbi:MAG: helix-turn-helix transcriptional regulator [Oscillospiraceae bacterium]|nr:helix-turn-helix transcriptional regulator [Oscillospiraceae bacterium]